MKTKCTYRSLDALVRDANRFLIEGGIAKPGDALLAATRGKAIDLLQRCGCESCCAALDEARGGPAGRLLN